MCVLQTKSFLGVLERVPVCHKVQRVVSRVAEPNRHSDEVVNVVRCEVDAERVARAAVGGFPGCAVHAEEAEWNFCVAEVAELAHRVDELVGAVALECDDESGDLIRFIKVDGNLQCGRWCFDGEHDIGSVGVGGVDPAPLVHARGPPREKCICHKMTDIVLKKSKKTRFRRSGSSETFKTVIELKIE